MPQLDRIDIVLIVLAVIALGVHHLYSRYKKRREEELSRNNKEPHVWSGVTEDDNKRD